MEPQLLDDEQLEKVDSPESQYLLHRLYKPLI